MTKQKDISKLLNVTPVYVSQLFSGVRPVSFPLALKLSRMFPEKGVEAWKNATPGEIKEALKKKDTDRPTQFQTKKNEVVIGEIDED